MALAIALNIAGLWPELHISRVDLNDNVFHFTLIEGMIQSIEQGGNPLDFWSPEWSFGYPVLRTYQPLAHALVVLAYSGLGKAVSAMTVFVWVRFLSVALLPLTFFAAARLISLGSLEAAAGLLAPLVSTNFLYGVEYGSFIWSGNGLFTQAVATHFLLLTIGFAFAGIRTGRRLRLAGIFLGLTFLSHFIYGYIGAHGLPAGRAARPESAAQFENSARAAAGRDGVPSGGIRADTDAARCAVHQPQPLGSGLEVGFVRRSAGPETFVHRRTA